AIIRNPSRRTSICASPASSREKVEEDQQPAGRDRDAEGHRLAQRADAAGGREIDRRRREAAPQRAQQQQRQGRTRQRRAERKGAEHRRWHPQGDRDEQLESPTGWQTWAPSARELNSPQ